MFRVGMCLDFVRRSGTTRTMHPHVGPQYVRRARRNRIDPHGGGIARLATRTPGSREYVGTIPIGLLTVKGGDVFRVGYFS